MRLYIHVAYRGRPAVLATVGLASLAVAAAPATASPATNRTVWFFGDSISAGLGLPSPSTQSWPAQVGLRADVTPVNWSKPRYAFRGYFGNISDELATAYASNLPIPHTVVVAAGTNDLPIYNTTTLVNAELAALRVRDSLLAHGAIRVLFAAVIPRGDGYEALRQQFNMWLALTFKGDYQAVDFFFNPAVPFPAQYYSPDLLHPNLDGATLIARTFDIGALVDDDPLPTLSIRDTSVTEGNTGVTHATFVVSLSKPSDQNISSDYVTADRTATAPSDYLSSSGTLTIAPGEASAQVSVPITGDTVGENDETFTVRLLDVSGATLGINSATGTIINDDGPIDTTAPSVHLTTPAAAFTTSAAAKVSWTGTDNVAVTGYQLRYQHAPYSAGFGAWLYPSSWQALPAATTSISLTALVQGHDYCFAVRAVDRAGNWSSWSSPRCTARALDDRLLTVSAHWSRSTGNLYWYQTVTTTRTAGATATRTGAQLDRIGLVATRGPGMGTVGMYVGTRLIGTINLASTTTQYQSLLTLPAFSYRAGTVTVKVLSTGKPVHIDGLALSRT